MQKQNLDRALGPFQATALVVGAIIGSGIFVSSASMARALPTGWQLIGVWVVAGILTAMGALTMAELGSRMPVTGGLYAYFRAVFGDKIAFFYGWANFMIAGSGAIAAIAFVFAGYLGEIIPIWHSPASWQEWSVHIPKVGTLHPGADFGQKLVASLLIFVLTALNAQGVRLGSLVQSICSSAKTFAIVLIIFAAFVFGKGSWSHFSEATAVSNPASWWGFVALWFTAMGGAFWSYDGWGNVAYVGEEIRDAQKNLPRAIVLGLAIVTTVYLLVNLAYIYVLPMSAIGQVPGDRLASAVMSSVTGPIGAMLIASLIVLSTFDAVNATILTNGRVYYAMAKDGWFWHRAQEVHPQHHTPAIALWMQGLWSIALLLSGSFDLITSMYVFVNWLFYFLVPVALFLLRKRDNGAEGTHFRVPFFPWLPIGFGVFTFAYLIQTLITDIRAYNDGSQICIQSVMGLLLVLTGTPLFIYFLKKNKLKQ